MASMEVSSGTLGQKLLVFRYVMKFTVVHSMYRSATTNIDITTIMNPLQLQRRCGEHPYT